ncbi:hypothetical protein [Pseudophaeobacter leonis]|uniref:hypothetical protein n=1 Tax=Pseudophaeobacter leonis TaxID=1144477 RepID=UPI00111C6430|nr:hypothetical protein [Pseudophaeobacter leonis]
MRTQPAYDAIALEYGGNAVFLRPSLRAAIHLERLHGGFPELLRKIEEFDTLTVWHVITASAGRPATDDLFGYASTQPLSGFAQAAQAPCFELVAALFPKASEAETTAPRNANPMPWSEVFASFTRSLPAGWGGRLIPYGTPHRRKSQTPLKAT